MNLKIILLPTVCLWKSVKSPEAHALKYVCFFNKIYVRDTLHLIMTGVVYVIICCVVNSD